MSRRRPFVVYHELVVAAAISVVGDCHRGTVADNRMHSTTVAPSIACTIGMVGCSPRWCTTEVMLRCRRLA